MRTLGSKKPSDESAVSDVENRDILPPKTWLRAARVGTLAGILLVTWAVGFSLFESNLSPLSSWTVRTGVGLLIVAIPCWLIGRRARREYLAKQDPPA